LTALIARSGWFAGVPWGVALLHKRRFSMQAFACKRASSF
jgi:hypothetical protein